MATDGSGRNGKGALYEYAVLYHPKQTKEQAERNEQPKSLLIVEPTRCVSATPDEVGMLAARAIPEGYIDKLADCEVVVSPF